MTHRIVLHHPDGSESAIAVRPDQHILDAALAAGMDLPYPRGDWGPE